MKRNLSLLTAAMFATSMFVAPALADDAMKSGSDTSGSSSSTMQSGSSTDTMNKTESGTMGSTTGSASSSTSGKVDTGTTASTSDANFGDVISSIQAGKTTATDIEGLTSVEKVNIVKIDDLPGNGNKEALENAVNKNKDQIDRLQAAIKANTALTEKLDAESVDVSNVVAAKTDTSGEVTVYVR